MDKFLIKGGKPLHGTVAISGAKNSALPVMAAALLTAEPVTLHNIPKVRDLITMSKLLAFMSADSFRIGISRQRLRHPGRHARRCCGSL